MTPLTTRPVSASEEQLFREIATRECEPLLAAVRAAFAPSKPIEEVVIAAFTTGARWALLGPKT